MTQIMEERNSDANEKENNPPSKMDNFKVIVGLLVSSITAFIGYKTYELNEKVEIGNQQLLAIERKLDEDKFAFERIRDIYDRVELYLQGEQSASRGKALVAFIRSIPDSGIKEDLLSVVISQSNSEETRLNAGAVIIETTDLSNISTISFIGKPDFESVSEDELLVKATYGFKDSEGNLWEVPKGYVYSRTIIPKHLWAVMGSPLEEPLRTGLALYQRNAEEQTRTSSQAAKMLYESLIATGVSEQKAKFIYYAVIQGGPRWG